MASALREAGVAAIVHDDRFPRDCADEVWLEEAGRNGWVVLTKDRRIRYRALARRGPFLARIQKGGRVRALTGS